MRVLRSLLLAALISVATCVPAAAQVLFDLAGTASLSQTVDPGSITVAVENRLPQARYTVTVRRELLAIAAIPFESVGSLGGLSRPRERAGDPCGPLASAANALNQATAESQVPSRRATVLTLLEQGSCTEADVIAAAKTVVSRTSEQLGPYPIRPGERLTVTITRPASEGQAPQWTLVLETEPRGEWVTTFGATFLPDRDELFHTEAAGDDKFKIVADQESTGLKVPMPSVYFSWLSTPQKRRNLQWSPTIGFGLDDESIGVFGGLSLTYNQNISVMGGVAIAGERRLMGRYKPDQEVGENLNEDQLHRVVYRPAPFVGVTVRFDRNPFKKDDPAPAAPSPGDAGAAPPAGAAPASPSPAPTGDDRAAPAGGAPPAREASRESDVKLRFDAQGRPRDASAVAALVQRAATATDVFIISHGWWNDESTADCFYRRIVGGLEAAKPSYLTGERFRPLFVTVYWPSALFPMEPGDCSERRTESSASIPSLTAAIVRQWAEAAFPDAASRPEFPAEAERLASLLERERAGSLPDAEGEALAAILVRWRTAADGTNTTGEGAEPGAFSGSPKEIADRWRKRPESRAELSLPNVAGAKKWLNFGNAFTFWTMKERAGTVGSRGLYEVVRALQPLRAKKVRLHLVGHSFGGKVVTASLTGSGGTPNHAETLVILQGAFSQFAFATQDEIRAAGVSVDRGGLYRDVLGSKLVSSPVVVTFSSADVPNRLLYPAGVALVNDVTEAARSPRYGALGALGVRGAGSVPLTLSVQKLGAVESLSPRAVSVDASGVILGHSDLIKPEVFRLIWDAVELSR